VERPHEQVDPVEDEDRGGHREQRGLGQVAAKYPPRKAPALEEGSMQQMTGHDTRPSRAWRTEPAAAEAALIPMFVPAAVLGLDASRIISGSRSVPSASPIAEPR
jgi:hypothetical protein